MAGEIMIDKYRHKLDQKSRVSIPAQFRKVLGDAFYLTLSDKNCLEGYTEEAYKKISDEFDELDPDIGLFWRANSALCEIDAQGRTFIPQELREKINLGQDVMLVGNGSMFLLWNTDEWKRVNEENSTQDKYAEMKKNLRGLREQKRGK
ncbi:MAG: hypothetical protein LBL25_02115 [Oscillospiraceae bacterium]|jgi:MraZ protein|nr:hypothetical protein [Oscillospiraceae bacterium]